MSLRDTQFGRFGDTLINHFHLRPGSIFDPDQQAAYFYARNGLSAIQRPLMDDILRSKGMCDQLSAEWGIWDSQFQLISNQREYVSTIVRLPSKCTGVLSNLPQGTCWHEFIPPISYFNLKGFFEQKLFRSLANNTIVFKGSTPNNRTFIPTGVYPMWNFVITLEGEIVIGSEDYTLIKHTCLSGGREVLSAGRVGIFNNQIRIVDLQSGHYIKDNVPPHSNQASLLEKFTQDVFVKYCSTFQISNALSTNFSCKWKMDTP